VGAFVVYDFDTVYNDFFAVTKEVQRNRVRKNEINEWKVLR